MLFLTDVYGLDAIELGLFRNDLFRRDLCHYPIGRSVVGSDALPLACGRQLRDHDLCAGRLALFPLPLLGAAALMLVQSLGGGLAMAALHRAAMEEIPTAESGSAAGLYSTARFGGGVVGATVAGVALQQALLFAPGPGVAYQWVFGGVAVISLTSLVVAWKLER